MGKPKYSEHVGRVEREIKKRSKITLLDRLSSVGKNIWHTPFTVIGPIITSGLVYSCVQLAMITNRVENQVKGYNDAQTQLSSIKHVLDINPTYWTNSPISPVVFTPIIESIDKSISNKYDVVQGNQWRDLTSKLQSSFSGTNNSPKEASIRKEYVDTAVRGLDYSVSSAMWGVASAIAGVLGAVVGLITGGVYKDGFKGDFTKYNEAKKNLRKR